ncbi:MAG: hypothetical protein J6040_09935, partial [Clostridiales bacterium]|nr:hypothetical protein [Clostridiales bacterium]MBP5492723.1 hypothetical protein [Clostridiales bacterium]
DFLLDTYKDIPILTSVPNLNVSSKGGYYGYRKAYAHAAGNAKKATYSTSEQAKKEVEHSGVRPGNEGK